MMSTRNAAIFPCRRAGFSLAETTIVLAIVAIFSAMAAPRYASSMARYRADLAARRIAADLVLARSEARMSGASRTVVFNPTARTYQLVGVTALNNSAGDYAVDLADDAYRASSLTADFNGQAQVTFDAYGAASDGGAVAIVVGELQRTITLDGPTGKVGIQ